LLSSLLLWRIRYSHAVLITEGLTSFDVHDVNECVEPQCVVEKVSMTAQSSLCSARRWLYLEQGDGRLPGTVAFPALESGPREAAWVTSFIELGYQVVEDTRAATFILSKQEDVIRVGFASAVNHGLCEDTQRLNQIPGQQLMCDKASFNHGMRRWASDSFMSHPPPKGFQLQAFLPVTYNLPDQQDCEAFISLLRKEGFKRKWILKRLQKQNTRGVKLLDHSLLKGMLLRFHFNNTCYFQGQGGNGAIIQQYLPKPVLILGHKIDLQVYMFVASTNPFMAFYYPVFSVRRSPAQYRHDEGNEKEGHAHTFTTGTSDKTVKPEKLNTFQYSPDEFQQYLFEHSKAPADYLQQYLQPMIKRYLSIILAANFNHFSRGKGFFAAYCVDLILDQDFHLWVLEVVLVCVHIFIQIHANWLARLASANFPTWVQLIGNNN